MRHKKTEQPMEPWYRQGWPWFLIAWPATAVVAGIATLIIAAKTFDGMVVDDYYKEGQAIVQTLGRVEQARRLGLRAALRVRSDSIHVELSATEPGSLPPRIRVTVAHPTRGGVAQQGRLADSMRNVEDRGLQFGEQLAEQVEQLAPENEVEVR